MCKTKAVEIKADLKTKVHDANKNMNRHYIYVVHVIDIPMIPYLLFQVI